MVTLVFSRLICSDLYGAIGVPTCLARTVVVGRKQELVSMILFILSYFIRCSEILESVESFPDFADTDDPFGSYSETSSVTNEGDLTLKSPVPDSNNESSDERKSGFRTTDLDDCQCCTNVSGCGASIETEAIRKRLALFVKPPETLNQIPLSDSKTSDNVDIPICPSSRYSGVERSTSSSPTKRQKSAPTVQPPCRLKEEDVRENHEIEIERTLGRLSDDLSPSKKSLHRVTLGDGPRTTVSDCIKDYLPAMNDQSPKKSELKHSNKKPTLQRGISIFDDLFDPNNPVPCLDIPLENSFLGSRLYDKKTAYDVDRLEDIVDVPCPDVSDFQIDRLKRRSETFDAGIDFEFHDSTQLDNEHFGEMDIEGVVNLADGPEKQFLQKAVSMLQDQFTNSGLSLDSGDRMVLSGDSIQDRLERSNSSHPNSAKNRHSSGQSLAMATNRCR